jgi:hypothetical protein
VSPDFLTVGGLSEMKEAVVETPAACDSFVSLSSFLYQVLLEALVVSWRRLRTWYVVEGLWS